MEIQKNIAARIRLAMEEKEVSLQEFAEEIGIARSSLQAYLKESTNLRADTIELLSEKMGIRPSKLISAPETHNKPDDNAIHEMEQRLNTLHPTLQPLVVRSYGLAEELFRISDSLYRMECRDEDETKLPP